MSWPMGEWMLVKWMSGMGSLFSLLAWALEGEILPRRHRGHRGGLLEGEDENGGFDYAALPSKRLRLRLCPKLRYRSICFVFSVDSVVFNDSEREGKPDLKGRRISARISPDENETGDI